MTRSWKSLIRPVLFTGAGALAGLLYYTFIGCAGSCPISSSPWLSMVWLGAVGWLLSGATQRG